MFKKFPISAGIKKVFILLLSMILIAGVATYLWIFKDLPSVEASAFHLAKPSIRITDRNGRLLYEVIDREGGRNSPVPLEVISKNVCNATIATEDQYFYQNPGIDLGGILRALWIDVTAGEVKAGGSTITQQVARTLLLGKEARTGPSLRRKAREMILAWQLTRRYGKDEILAFYLNQVYYGGFAYGIEAAAQTYFNKPVSRLDLAESALLAGLPQAPSAYNPFTNLTGAKERQKVVLERMRQEGYISAEEARLAEQETLYFASAPYPIEAPHFVLYVRSLIDEMYSSEDIAANGGFTVRTSLNLDWQHAAEAAVSHQLQALQSNEYGVSHNVNSAALTALDPQSGDILAMVGSPDYFDQENAGAINMARTPRQPGSALKPLVYSLALNPEQPEPWTAATMLLDVRTSFTTHDNQVFIPANFDNQEHGPVLLREALAASLNIPAVITLDHVRIPAVFDLASRLGIYTLHDPNQYDLSLALGGGEVSLLELTGAYAAFANGGYATRPNAILEIRNSAGNVIYQSQTRERIRVIDERVTWLISDILSDSDARIRSFGENSMLSLDRPAAAKTGTTSNFHDNWTIGYTPELAAGVWVGNTGHEAMRSVTGVTGAAPIWHEFMLTVLAGRPKLAFQRPEGLVQVEVCAMSGMLPTEACPYRKLEWFIDGTQPRQADTMYQVVEIDTATGLLAGADTPPDRIRKEIVLNLPPQAVPWARTQGLRIFADLQPGGQPVGMHPTGAPFLRVDFPPNQARFQIDRNFSIQAQRIMIQIVADPGLQQITLWMDGTKIAALENMHPQFAWQLQEGTHYLQAKALDAQGNAVASDEVIFFVEPDPQSTGSR